MSREYFQASARRLSGNFDRATLLRGAVRDVLENLPVEELLLVASPAEEYGAAGPGGERVDLGDEAYLRIVLASRLEASERREVRELVEGQVQACLTVASRLEASWAEVERLRALLEESRERVVQSSKMAEVGQLAAGLAHDLNSPIGGVLLQLEAAKLSLERQRYERAAQKIDSAERAADSAREIVSRLLLYCRQAARELGEVDLNEVVREAVDQLGGQWQEEALELRLDLSSLPRVPADSASLRQVVTNLLVNARDAVLGANTVGGVVAVSTFDNGDTVGLEVRDSGPGISDVAMARLFVPFFTTKPPGKGSGLGLSMSLKIVEEHSGRLWAENAPEGGARFRMLLPSNIKAPSAPAVEGE